MELLFRGITCKTHKVVYGNYIKSDRSLNGFRFHRDWIVQNAMTNGGWFALMGKWPVVNGSVEQYTGRKDKNGIKVFGGDIIMSLAKGNTKYVIEYNEEHACWEAKSIAIGMAFHLIDKFVVIGNIYEDGEYVKKL